MEEKDRKIAFEAATNLVCRLLKEDMIKPGPLSFALNTSVIENIVRSVTISPQAWEDSPHSHKPSFQGPVRLHLIDVPESYLPQKKVEPKEMMKYLAAENAELMDKLNQRNKQIESLMQKQEEQNRQQNQKALATSDNERAAPGIQPGQPGSASIAVTPVPQLPPAMRAPCTGHPGTVPAPSAHTGGNRGPTGQRQQDYSALLSKQLACILRYKASQYPITIKPNGYMKQSDVLQKALNCRQCDFEKVVRYSTSKDGTLRFEQTKIDGETYIRAVRRPHV